MPQARSYLFKQKSALNEYAEKAVIQINIPRLQRSYLTKDSYLQFTVQLTGNPGYYINKAGVTGPPATYNQFALNQLLCCDNPGGYSFIDKIEVYDYLGSTLLESTAGHAQLMSLLLDGMGSSTQNKKMTVYAGTGKQEIGLNADLTGYGAFDSTQAAIPTTARRVNTTCMYGPVSGAPFQFNSSAGGVELGSVTGNTGIPANAIETETIQKEFSIPLLSFLGLLSPKYTPLHNGFTINITLNSRAIAMGRFQVCTTASATAGAQVALGTITDFKVKNVSFCAQVLELGPVAESMLLSSTQGNPLIVHSKAYRNFVTYLQSNTSNFRFDLNLNVASMSAILWMLRPTFNLNSTNAEYCRSLSQRIRNYMTSWYFQYGSSILPQTTGIKTMTSQTFDAHNRSGLGGSEAYVELMKALKKFHAVGEESSFTDANYNNDIQQVVRTTATPFTLVNTLNAATGVPNTGDEVKQDDLHSPPFYLVPGGNLTRQGYDETIAGVTNATYGNCGYSSLNDTSRFAAGLNLELSPEHSYEIVSGLNTNGMNTSINATFASNMLGYQQECQVDAWCEYDAFINITPGLASTVSF
jgi:hypothetical protein